MLESNASQREPTGKGAAKKRPALLAGLLRCEHWGGYSFVDRSGAYLDELDVSNSFGVS